MGLALLPAVAAGILVGGIVAAVAVTMLLSTIADAEEPPIE